MKKILFVLCMCIGSMFFACSPKITDPYTYGTSMMKEYSKMFSVYQFDSICIADSISNNLNKWHQFKYMDVETGRRESEYSYIKKLGTNQIIYILEPSHISDSVFITKRTTK